MSEVTVKFGVYGALANGNENRAQANDVSGALQNAINAEDAVVTINNDNMGGDPSPGNEKHFGATISRDGGTYYYACKEGQTVDFKHGGVPAS